MSEIVGFLGVSPMDICLYTAFSTQNRGKSVCVLDQSKDGLLYHCIPSPGGQLEVVTYHGVDFIRSQPLVQWQDMHYDVIFVQMGGQPQQLCLALCTKLVLVVDCERENLDFYRRFMQESKMPMTVLLRGFFPGTIPVKERKEYFANGNDFIEKWMVLPVNEADEAYRMRMQYGQFNKFAYISHKMQNVLVQLLRHMGAANQMEALRAVKQAKYGRSAFVFTSGWRGSEKKMPGIFKAIGYGG